MCGVEMVFMVLCILDLSQFEVLFISTPHISPRGLLVLPHGHSDVGRRRCGRLDWLCGGTEYSGKE